MRRSLEGLRVIDLTTSVAGPFATMILGDLGADVIKIERPGVGDDTRHWGPPRWNGESCHFNALNRNKRSVALDLGTPEGIEAVRDLARGADILLENLRPGSLQRKGLGFDDLRSINPALIYVTISGYGPRGPRAESPAYDPLMQAYSGLMSMVGAPGSEPARIPVSILDQGSGMWAVIGALNALRSREATGEGSHVQTSLLGTALMWQPVQVANWYAGGALPERLGSGTIGIYPYGHFPTADSDIVIAAGNQRLWERLCSVIGADELVEDPRFLTNEDRVARRDPLRLLLAERLERRASREWIAALDAAGVPCAPINRLDQALADPQVAEGGFIADIEHPRIPGYRAVALPLEDETGPVGRYAPAPDLGAHNEEILGKGGAR